MKDKRGRVIAQGDIYWINFDPSVGAEIQKKRPAIVLQDQNIFEYERTILVCPILSSQSPHPFDISLKGYKDLKDLSRARITQLKTVDISRFDQFIVPLEREDLYRVTDHIQILLGI